MSLLVIALVIILVLYNLIYNSTGTIIRYKSKKNTPSIPIKKMVFIGGQHGNEPSGTIALEQMHSYFNKWVNNHPNLEIIVVPRINKVGLLLNIRQTLYPYCMDSNRCWHVDSNLSIIKRLLPLIKDASIVVDFHEGYDIHKNNKSSLGSTISGGTTDNAIELGKSIANLIEFTYHDRSPCDTDGTLNCYCQENKIPFFLVETTRGPNWSANPILPMKVRVNQVKKIIQTTLKDI